MTIIGEAFVAVKPDTQGFGPDAEKGVLSSVTSIAKKAGAIIGGAFVAQKGFDFLKDSVAAARESNEVAAQTAAAIKSTGGAAKVSAGEVDKLANSIARKTGIDDEQIGKAENLLLTFTNVRNEAGKGNDIFNQSTKILADMGKALGTDASGAAIQLGKALNDPIAGISALTRVGVTFDDKQKDLIKTLVESGKTADAQKIILAELNKEFGGSAEATATSSAKLKVALGNIQETIGNKLIPIIDKAAGFIADRLPGALDAAGRGFGKIQKLLQPVIIGVQDFIQTFRDPDVTSGGIFGDIEKAASKAREIFDQTLPVVKEFTAFVKDNLKPILIGLGAALLVAVGPLVAVGAAFVVAYAKSQTFRDIVNAVIADVTKIIGGLVQFVQTNLPAFQEAFEHVVNAVVAIFQTALPIILPIVQGVISAVTTVIQTVVEVIKQVVLFVTNIINGDFAAAFGNLKNVVFTVIGGVLDLIGGLGPKLLEALGRIAGLAGQAALGIGKAIIDGIGHGLSAAAGFVGDLGKSIINSLKNLINKQVIDRINDAIPDSLGAGPFKINFPKNPIPRLAAGALVRATPGGTFANIAEAGRDEAVVPLPVGLVEGLQAIARGARLGGDQPLIGEINLNGTLTSEAADANASAIVRRMRAEAALLGK